MKKSVLLILLCVILSVSLFAAVTPSGVDDSLGTILTFPVLEIQAVSVQDFGGVAVLSVNLSEQIVNMYTAVGASAYIGLEMENYLESDNKMLIVTNINGLRGGTALFADHYKQLSFT